MDITLEQWPEGLVDVYNNDNRLGYININPLDVNHSFAMHKNCASLFYIELKPNGLLTTVVGSLIKQLTTNNPILEALIIDSPRTCYKKKWLSTANHLVEDKIIKRHYWSPYRDLVLALPNYLSQ
ncbi:MAG: hypothetical protein WC307_04750 [Candidatus Nanoarchaeia archaeon]